MDLNELFDSNDENLTESAKRVWARKGNKVTRKFRCTSGKKKGRLVSTASECGKPLDLKKRQKFKALMLSKGKRLRKKARRTKRYNPTSIRVQRMNKVK